jgi:flagellar hook-associated protein 2
MSTSVSSILSSLASLLSSTSTTGLTSSTSGTSTAASSAVQDAVNAILNSATNTSGSGLDVQSTVNAILQLESGPVQQLQQQETTLNTQAAALKSIESDLEAFQTSVYALNDFSGAFGALAVTSSDNNVVSATAANGTTTGTHTITVNNLATTSSYYSAAFSSGSAEIPTGSFDIQVGNSQPVTVFVTSSDNTLDGLAAQINQQDIGVTASVITDAMGARLALVSQTSGAPGDLTITNDTTGTSGNGMGFSKAADGTNASLTVDGIPISSTSNTVCGVIPGVTLTLSSAAPNSPVMIGIQPDLTQVAAAINTFVSSYNRVIQDINAQYQYDTSTNTAGPLMGDSALDLVQEQLLAGISSSITGNNGLVNLESIGISVQDNGTLSVDSTTLNNALANNYSAVQNLFQSTSPSGVAQTLNQDLTWLTNRVTGPLNVDLSGIGQEVSDLNQQISDFQTQLQTRQQQLTAEYSQINTILEQLPQTIAQINSQLDALNPSK